MEIVDNDNLNDSEIVTMAVFVVIFVCDNNMYVSNAVVYFIVSVHQYNISAAGIVLMEFAWNSTSHLSLFPVVHVASNNFCQI